MSPWLLVVIIVVSVLVIFYLLFFIMNDVVLNKIYGRRGDGTISIKYALPSEQKNLIVKKNYFLNNKKARLFVYEYTKIDNENPKGLILLIHGIGAGHFYLFPIINYLCELGYVVVAYDQYASGTSEGKKIKSMTQGCIDVKYAVRYIEKNYNLPFYVMGHSWGGYCATQALRYSKKIIKCVNIAGLDSEASMAKEMFKPAWLMVTLMRLCSFTHFGFKAFYTSYGIMKKSSAKILYLQGLDDNIVNPKTNGLFYKDAFKDKDNIKIVMIEGKGHSPFNDYESQNKQNKVMAEFGLLGGVLVDMSIYIDYPSISVPDMEVLKIISDFLAN